MNSLGDLANFTRVRRVSGHSDSTLQVSQYSNTNGSLRSINVSETVRLSIYSTGYRTAQDVNGNIYIAIVERSATNPRLSDLLILVLDRDWNERSRSIAVSAVGIIALSISANSPQEILISWTGRERPGAEISSHVGLYNSIQGRLEFDYIAASENFNDGTSARPIIFAKIRGGIIAATFSKRRKNGKCELLYCTIGLDGISSAPAIVIEHNIYERSGVNVFIEVTDRNEILLTATRAPHIEGEHNDRTKNFLHGFNPDGTRLFDRISIPSQAWSSQSAATIASDVNGLIAISCVEVRRRSGGSHAFLFLYDARGNIVGEPITVHRKVGNKKFSYVKHTGGKNFIVGWMDAAQLFQSSSGFSVYCSSFDGTTMSLGLPFEVFTGLKAQEFFQMM